MSQIGNRPCPLISEAKPISQIHLSSTNPQSHPDRNQGHRFRSLLLQRVPDWGLPSGAMLGCDIPSLQRSHLPNRPPPASVLTDRGFLKFSPWPCWRQNFPFPGPSLPRGARSSCDNHSPLSVTTLKNFRRPLNSHHLVSDRSLEPTRYFGFYQKKCGRV
jgi:hypothetical protein